MNVLESIAGGLSSIWSHKLRSSLTLFGIVVGVASVVAMFSFVGGIGDRIMEDFEQLGYDNVFFVGSRPPDNPDNLASLRISKGLTLEDTEVLRREVPDIEWLTPAVSSYVVGRAGSEARRFSVFGATPDGFPLLKLEIGEGRPLTWTDIEKIPRRDQAPTGDIDVLTVPLGSSQNQYSTYTSPMWTLSVRLMVNMKGEPVNATVSERSSSSCGRSSSKTKTVVRSVWFQLPDVSTAEK